MTSPSSTKPPSKAKTFYSLAVEADAHRQQPPWLRSSAQHIPSEAAEVTVGCAGAAAAVKGTSQTVASLVKTMGFDGQDLPRSSEMRSWSLEEISRNVGTKKGLLSIFESVSSSKKERVGYWSGLG